MRPVHLCVVKLERHRELCLEEAFAVSAPYHERIVENAAVHAHGPVDVLSGEGRGANHHAFLQVVVLARTGNLLRQLRVVAAEALQVVGERNVA